MNPLSSYCCLALDIYIYIYIYIYIIIGDCKYIFINDFYKQLYAGDGCLLISILNINKSFETIVLIEICHILHTLTKMIKESPLPHLAYLAFTI